MKWLVLFLAVALLGACSLIQKAERALDQTSIGLEKVNAALATVEKGTAWVKEFAMKADTDMDGKLSWKEFLIGLGVVAGGGGVLDYFGKKRVSRKVGKLWAAMNGKTAPPAS